MSLRRLTAWALTFADCEAIVDACHDVDDGSGGMPTICHDTAHDADSDDDCAPLRVECVAACTAIDGGVARRPEGGVTCRDAQCSFDRGRV